MRLMTEGLDIAHVLCVDKRGPCAGAHAGPGRAAPGQLPACVHINDTVMTDGRMSQTMLKKISIKYPLSDGCYNVQPRLAADEDNMINSQKNSSGCPSKNV